MSHSQEGMDQGLNLVPLAPEPPTFQSSTPRQKDWKQGALGCGSSSPLGHSLSLGCFFSVWDQQSPPGRVGAQLR